MSVSAALCSVLCVLDLLRIKQCLSAVISDQRFILFIDMTPFVNSTECGEQTAQPPCSGL